MNYLKGCGFMVIKFVISLILAVGVAIFAIQNSEPVAVKFFVSEMMISQALVILLSAIVGAIIAFSLGLVKQFSMSKNIKGTNKRVIELEVENSSLKLDVERLKNDALVAASIPATSYEDTAIYTKPADKYW